MYITITSLLLLVATNKLMAGEGICQRRHQVETIAVCDEEYSKYCCPNIHLHDGSLSNRHFQKCKGGNMSCKGGFYSRDGSTSSCPLGYFCPHGRRCMVPCFSGDYCPGYQMIDNTTCTHPVEPSLQPLVINNTTVCPGDYRNRRCQKGFYCPKPWEKVECPPGKKCLEGFSYPLRCNMFGKCDFGGGENTVGFLVLFALALVIAIILVLKYRLRRRSMLLREEVACFLKQADDQEDSRDSPVSRSPSLSSLKMMRSSRKKSRSHFNIPAALWSSLKVDITGYRESLPKINNAFTIQLEDFAYTLKSGRKLLRGIDVTFQHSKINVIMGPSGCGKSTLINSIMGYNKDNGHTSGNLYLNGVHIKTLSKIKNYVGYLTQHDIMHDNLTVKEILTYQAQLKLPEEDKDNAYITSSVTEVINLLALNQIGDRVVGNLDDNLISGGQRRRLSIAMELITNPSILILDEPTSGLDSATALIIMQLLRNLSHQMRINIICIIHQPRVELFSLFDNLTLLTTTGRVAYNAQASLIKDYFRNLGFTFPDHANPADIIIDILSGFIVSEEYEVRHLYKVWKKEQNKRELSASVIDLLDGVEGSTHSVETLLSRDNPQQLDKRKMTSRGYFDQWLVMMHRECVSDIRFFHHRLAEIVIAFVLGLGMAFLFRDLIRGMETTKVNLEIVTVGLLVSVSSLRTFGRDRLIFLREAKSGVHTFSYFFAKTIVHLPTICFFIPAPFVGIYWTGGDFKGSFGFTYLLVTLAAFAASGISYLISVVCKPNLANLMSIGVTLISSMFAGCTLTLCDLDSLSGLGPLLYSISYSRWFVQSQLISEWSTYDQTYKMYFDRRFWMNKYTDAGATEGMIILFIFGVLFRFLTLMVLFYQKANISILHEIRLFLRERKERKRERRPESNVTMSDFKARLKTYDRRQKQTLI